METIFFPPLFFSLPFLGTSTKLCNYHLLFFAPTLSFAHTPVSDHSSQELSWHIVIGSWETARRRPSYLLTLWYTPPLDGQNCVRGVDNSVSSPSLPKLFLSSWVLKPKEFSRFADTRQSEHIGFII